MKKIEFYENKNIISQRLKEARRGAGISQTQLAAKLQTMNINIDQQMISKIENNSRLVTDYELACLCECLDIEPAWLLRDYKKFAEQA